MTASWRKRLRAADAKMATSTHLSGNVSRNSVCSTNAASRRASDALMTRANRSPTPARTSARAGYVTYAAAVQGAGSLRRLQKAVTSGTNSVAANTSAIRRKKTFVSPTVSPAVSGVPNADSGPSARRVWRKNHISSLQPCGNRNSPPKPLTALRNCGCYRVSISQRRGRRTGQECPCRARVGSCTFQGGGTDAPQRESRVRKAPTHLEHARRTPYVRTGGHARRHVRGSIYGLRAGRHRHASRQRHRLERRRRPGRDRHCDGNADQQQPARPSATRPGTTFSRASRTEPTRSKPSCRGFAKIVRQNVRVDVNTTMRVDLTLELGQLTESVTVAADTPLLQTDRTDTGRHHRLEDGE